MNFFTSRTLIVFACFIVYLAILVTVPIRRCYILSKLGKVRVGVSKKNTRMQVFCVVIAGIVLVLLFFKDFGFFVNLIICLTAILAAAMSSEDASLSSFAGLYEKGIVGDGHFLLIPEMFSILEPDCSVSQEDASRILRIQTVKKGIVTFVFILPEEKEAVYESLIEICPTLKK